MSNGRLHECFNNARSALLPSRAWREECSWSELFSRVLKAPSLHLLFEHRQCPYSQVSITAHKDHLDPAVCFNYTAKHSIYHHLRAQQTTALYLYFPSFLNVWSQMGCRQRAFMMLAGATHPILMLHFQLTYVFAKPEQNRIAIVTTITQHWVGCWVMSAQALPLKLLICCDNGAFGAPNKLSHLFDSTLYYTQMSYSTVQYVSINCKSDTCQQQVKLLNWYCLGNMKSKFWCYGSYPSVILASYSKLLQTLQHY